MTYIAKQAAIIGVVLAIVVVGVCLMLASPFERRR